MKQNHGSNVYIYGTKPRQFAYMSVGRKPGGCLRMRKRKFSQEIYEAVMTVRRSASILPGETSRNPMSTPATSPRRRRCVELALKTRTVEDDVAVLSVTGRIVFKQEAQALCHQVSRIFHNNSHLIINLSGVDCIDGSGLGALAQCVQTARDSGCDIKFCNARPHIQELLQLTRLTSVLDLYDSETEALQAFASEAA